MKLSDSLKYVLKVKSHQVFTTAVVQAVKGSFTQDNGFSFKHGFRNIKDNAVTTFLIIKDLPLRLQTGFQLFFTDYIQELALISSPTERAKFAMKTLACLTRLVVSGFYDIGLGNMNLIGGKKMAPLTKLAMARMVFKTLQSVIVQMVDEVSVQIENEDDRKQLQRYKELLLDDKRNAIDLIFEEVVDTNDPSYKIVDNFKNYIFTGERLSR